MTWAIVLGGSSGLGLKSAQRLADDGYKLCVVYREPRANQTRVLQAMNDLAERAPSLIHFNADALSEAGRSQVIDALEKNLLSGESVAVVLHSIAKGALKPLYARSVPGTERTPLEASAFAIGDERPDDSETAHNPNLTRPAELTALDVKLTLDAMGTSLLDWVADLRARQLFAKDTRILAFTSEGSQRVWPGYGAVSAAKATLESLIRTIAYELGPLGIRANCIQAGVTDTPALRRIPNAELIKQHALARNPMGRLTVPEDVANVVSLLCKPEAAWINGTVIIVDGGEHLC